jgi:hypothetical protein
MVVAFDGSSPAEMDAWKIAPISNDRLTTPARFA